MKRKVFIIVLFALMMAVGCASSRLEKLEVDIDHLKKEIRSLNRSEADLINETKRLRLKVAELEQKLEREKSDRKKLEEELFQLNLRLDEMVKEISPPKEEKLPPLPEGKKTPKEVYDSAYRLFSSGRYEEAERGFVDFLKRFPESDLSDNAQYWIGEIYYLRRDFRRAIKEFSKVINAYPFANKVPDAYFKLGLCHYNLRNYQQAKKFFEHTVRLFPHSEAASRAKRMLQKLKERK